MFSRDEGEVCFTGIYGDNTISCVFMNARVCVILEGAVMCGQNIPHLDNFLCVLLRRDLQVGGGVFASRMIICVFNSACSTSGGMLLFSLGS